MKRIASLLLALMMLCAVLTPLSIPAAAEGDIIDTPAPPVVDPGTGDIPGSNDPIDIPPQDPIENTPPENPVPENPIPEYTTPEYTVPEYTTPETFPEYIYPVDPYPTVPTVPTLPAISTSLPKVTKDPTDELVKEGGYAEFVARAENITDIIWHISSPTGGTDILAKYACDYFPGLWVYGLNSERLGLEHIPKEMHQWQVYAEFVNSYGTVLSNYAIISVQSPQPDPPTIYEQPRSVRLKPNEATLLRAGAIAAETDATLTYQWYRNTTNSNIGGKAITGANTPTYTPDYIVGTTYYYCAIRSSNAMEVSEAAKTDCAAVTYDEITQPTTEPTTIPTTVPTTAPTTQPTISFTTQPTQEETLPAVTAPTLKRDNSLLVVVVIVIIIIAILGILATVLILKFYPGSDNDDDFDDDDEEYGDDPATATVVNTDNGWDDLSDLGDLSIYLGEDDK